MVRKVALGNGSLLVNLDSSLRVRDLYFPYAGQENHVLGKKFGIGIHGDGFSWISSWETSPRYMEDTIVTESEARNQIEDLKMVFRSCVECEKNAFLREIELFNEREESREIEIFFAHDFDMYGNKMADTAAFRPQENGIVHYKKERYAMVNVKEKEGTCANFDQYGVYRGNVGQAIESGELNGDPIAQGDVQSAISVKLEIGPEGSEKFYYWINTGEDFDEVRELNREIEDRAEDFIDQTSMCWRGYLGKLDCDLENLEKHIQDQLKRSILVMRAETGDNGAITAANDSTNLEYNQDKYGYVWPRDAALVSEIMTRSGYGDLVRPFFDFMEEVIEEEGFLLHKYNPDRSLGSSWHPWTNSEGEKQLPIQEDETALTIWALKKYSEHEKNTEILEERWETLVKPAAEFMSDYFDEELSLPEPSYDLWEEKRYISTFTVAAVHAGLEAAADIAYKLDENGKKYEWRAKKIQEEGLDELVTEDGVFSRGIEDGETIDGVSAPLVFLEKLGLVEEDDPRFEATLERIREDLEVDTEVGGIARYRGDTYHSKTDDFEKVPGNPWIICTLWMAQQEMKSAENHDELEEAAETMHWACENSLETGVLPEQVDPFTGKGVSVAPLTWSHATFIETALLYSDRKAQLTN